MASLRCDGAGLWLLQVVGTDGGRYSIRLGRIDKRQAEAVHRYVEDLVACKVSGEAPGPATGEWLAKVPDRIRAGLVRAGLAQERRRSVCPTVADWTARYMAGRSDLKPGTLRHLRQCADNLAAFLGPAKRLDEVTEAAAEQFRVFLKVDCKLGEGTVRRRLKRARQFFTAAVKARVLPENVFAGLRCGDFSDAGRFHFVTREEIAAVLAACPDSEWRLIFVLARFGGLRTPSEVLSLTWAGVNWERSRFAVRAAKTEDTGADGGTRFVPIFPELLPHLREAFEAAAPGAVYVVAKHRAENLRTQAARIIRAAGVAPWPKLFVNCRASAEIELCERFPQHVVAKWLGHSPAVALRHYLAVTEDHFRAAAEGVVHQKCSARDSNSVAGASEMQRAGFELGSAGRGAEGAARAAKMMQQVQAKTRKDLQDADAVEPAAERNPLNCEELRERAKPCENIENISKYELVTLTGLEPVS